jgi:hypothetical protein
MSILAVRRSPKLVLIALLSFYRIWLIQSHPGWSWNRRRVLSSASSSSVEKIFDDVVDQRQLSKTRRESFIRHIAAVLRGGGQTGSDDDGEGYEVYGDIVDDENGDEIDDKNLFTVVGTNATGEDDDDTAGIDDDHTTSASERMSSTVTPYVSIAQPRPNRHCSGVITDLSRGAVVDDGEESLALRELIASRTGEFVLDLEQRVAEIIDLPRNERKAKSLPHPRKLLHYLAPKIPAIKQSPDVNLRIHSSRSDIDPGCAACIIGMLAHACELYDSSAVKIGDSMERSASFDIVDDRRFEQLVECVVSGINIEKRIRESKKREGLSRETEKHIGDDEMPEIQDVLDNEDVRFDDGIGIRDACRAAYGLAALGTHQVSSLGGVVIKDLLLALSLRVRELLLARFQLLRRDDTTDYIEDSVVTTAEKLNQLSEELAQDTASTLWSFACVRVLTGCRSNSLIETCCAILCSQLTELRQKAQEAACESGRSNGASDVIEPLARSKTGLHNPVDEANVEGHSNTVLEDEIDINVFANQPELDQWDVLLDCLSPTEVKDVLWGVALHGSSNHTSGREDINLSVTAATLRETASDRIIEWLRSDMRTWQDSVENDDLVQSSKRGENVEAGDEPSEDVNIDEKHVNIHSLTNDTIQEIIEAKSDIMSAEASGDSEIQEVQVVDAARLLASNTNEEEIDVTTELFVAPALMVEGNDDDKIDAVGVASKPEAIFSSHDLASIAWSLTELNDTSKDTVVGMVMERFSQLEPSGIAELSGNDLSNLAWAISKDDNAPHQTSSTLIRSIILRALANTHKVDVLEFLQPPELGRLMWAAAWVLQKRDRSHTNREDTRDIMAFSDLALTTAAESSNVFNVEELARIIYAWLEFSGPDYINLDLQTATALGITLSTIEQSLQRWEKGDWLSPGSSRTDSHTSQPTTLFGSLFGRSRQNPLMEHAVFIADDDDDSRSHRPKLRDLNLDPSTLIKIALGVNRLGTAQKSMVDIGNVLTRVAIRLMSSKSGKLLRICSMDDMARLCEAACLCRESLDLPVAYFSRQAVQVLNEGVDCSDLSMPMKCTLVWSLGRLGIRCSPDPAEKHKLEITHLTKILDGVNLSDLELENLHQLLQGLLAMRYVAISGSAIVLELLKHLQLKLHGVGSTNDILCDIAETLVSLIEEEQRLKNSSGDVSSAEISEDAATNDETSEERTVLTESMSILTSIASTIADRSSGLTCSQICRLLDVYCILPFQADEMIKSLEDEVSVRRAILLSLPTRKGYTLDMLLRKATESIENLSGALLEESSTSIFRSLKAGIVSLFSPEETTSKEEEEMRNSKEEIVTMIKECFSAVSGPSHRISKFQEALKKSIEALMKESENCAALDLGKAQDLIETYRRVEFVTGKPRSRRSRYDQIRRENITKRVLSRLLP